MSHEDVKLEAWQAAVPPKPDCCTESMLKVSGLTVGSSVLYVKITLGNAVQSMFGP